MSRIDRFKPELLQAAHKASMDHRAAIEASDAVGCFSCRKSYEPSLIRDWVDDGQTALCRKCGIDAVVPGAGGYPVTDTNFLAALKRTRPQ